MTAFKTVLKTPLALLLLVAPGFACGGSQATPTRDPAAEVQQLITLYKENRVKFVEQKQALSDGSDCARATRLREAADAIAADAAMSPSNTDEIKAVHLELKEAEKSCKSK